MLKKELDKMEVEGIIRPCPETTDWVHNLITVVKKNGTLCLCLDPRNLNRYLIQNMHYTASWEDAQHSFRNGQYFSMLDAKSGYWTKRLSEGANSSQHLILCSKSTASYSCHLDSQCHLKSSASRWIGLWQAFQAHSYVQMMSKCKDPQKRGMTSIFLRWY